uniref:Uncharacterized protein n=1 Tax=Rousettus aegyptiacus TaxID=9407 RepID=A0A7J8C293_ROUAE|nr:hypothetical protein HJG63_009295 [Rousettus aegyptiacus]
MRPHRGGSGPQTFAPCASSSRQVWRSQPVLVQAPALPQAALWPAVDLAPCLSFLICKVGMSMMILTESTLWPVSLGESLAHREGSSIARLLMIFKEINSLKTSIPFFLLSTHCKPNSMLGSD